MAGDERVHNLALKPECAEHFRTELTPHPVDIIPVSHLKFMGADAVAPNRSHVVGYTYVWKVAERNVKRHKRYTEYKDEDHPDPFQGWALTPHEI